MNQESVAEESFDDTDRLPGLVLDSLCCLDALLSLKGKLLCNLKGREVMR